MRSTRNAVADLCVLSVCLIAWTVLTVCGNRAGARTVLLDYNGMQNCQMEDLEGELRWEVLGLLCCICALAF